MGPSQMSWKGKRPSPKSRESPFPSPDIQKGRYLPCHLTIRKDSVQSADPHEGPGKGRGPSPSYTPKHTHTNIVQSAGLDEGHDRDRGLLC